MSRSTHTYVLLEISEGAYLEIKKKLEEAGYGHAFHENPDAPDSPRIDMHGIALIPEQTTLEREKMVGPEVPHI